MKKTITFFLLSFIFKNSFSQGLSLPYYSGYDSPAETAGWQEYRTGFLSTYNWGIGGSGFSAPSALSHDYNVGGSSNDTVIDWFVSPPINFTAPGLLSLKVKTSGFSTPFPDNFEVWFGTGSQDPEVGNFSLIANLSFMLPQFQWLDTTIEVPFTTDSGYIAFKYKTIGAAWSTYAVDNIQLNIDSTVSVNERLLGEKSISIYPNPVSTSASIKIDGLHNDVNTDVQLFNNTGALVNKFNLDFNNEIIFNRENLPAGVYFVKVIQQEKIVGARSFIIE